jgi:hypothetical protein
MDGFIKAQLANFDIGSSNQFFKTLIPAADTAYQAAIACVPKDGVPMFGRILLICHKSLLSAAVLIAKLQPEDSVGITRRAGGVSRSPRNEAQPAECGRVDFVPGATRSLAEEA